MIGWAAAVAILGLMGTSANMEILRFTTPMHDAVMDSLAEQCFESIAPVGPLGAAELWRLGGAAPEQQHPARPAGAPDSFLVNCQGEQRTYLVRFCKLTGVRSCPSNWLTLNGRTEVGPAGMLGPGPWLGIPRPNPTRGLVAVSLCLPEAGAASLEVLDVAGRRVARLISGERRAGVHIAVWDARALPPGIYLVAARIGAWRASRRVLVVR